MTHCEKVLALLSDGKPHSHHELYALHVIAHSRISDLRSQGHTIDQWHEGDLYLYQLRRLDRGHEDNGARDEANPLSASPVAVAPIESTDGQLSIAVAQHSYERDAA